MSERPPWGKVCGLTIGRVLHYIDDYNRLHLHDKSAYDESWTMRHWGIKSADFVFIEGQELFGDWRVGTPYGTILTCGESGLKSFEPAQGFDLASQDWPPCR